MQQPLSLLSHSIGAGRVTLASLWCCLLLDVSEWCMVLRVDGVAKMTCVPHYAMLWAGSLRCSGCATAKLCIMLSVSFSGHVARMAADTHSCCC